MRPGFRERIRRRLGLGGAAEETEPRRASPPAAEEEREVIDEIAAEFTTEELQEFLEADRQPVPVDPVFKDRLRERLWQLVEERRAHDGQKSRN